MFLVFFLIKVKRTHILLIRLKEINYSSNIQKTPGFFRIIRFLLEKIPFPEFFGRKSPLGFEFWDLDLKKKPTSACKDLLLIKHELKSDGEIKLQLEQKGYIFIHLRFL